MRRLSIVVVAAFAMIGIATGAHANKCTAAKLKAVGKKESGLLGCQAKVAATGDSSGLSACEMKVKDKFAAAFGKVGTCAGDETRCEGIADACDSAMTAFLTETFPSKCEAAKRKAAGKLGKGELGCYSKATAKALPLDTSCIAKAQGKFGTALTKAGTCPDGSNPHGGGGTPQEEVETNCVKAAVTTDGAGTVTDVCPPTTTTTTTIPCNNGNFTPFPTCAGTCPTGYACQATAADYCHASQFTSVGTCQCVPSTSSCCASGAGVCPPNQVCTSTESSDGSTGCPPPGGLPLCTGCQ